MKLSFLWAASSRAVAGCVGLAALAIHTLIAWRFPVMPFEKYTVAAQMLLDGRLAPERWIDFSPLYLYLAAFDQVLPGLGLQALQFLASAATVSVFFLWAEPRLGRGWALGAAVALIFDRHLLVYQRVLEPEVLFLFLVMLFLLWIDGPEGEPRRPLAAGVVAALGLAVRPTFLPLFALALLVWAWNRRGEPRRMLPGAVFFVAPVVLVLGLLALRAQVATGSLRSPTMNPGTVLFEGNQPLSRGTSAVYPPLVHLLSRIPDGTPDAAHVYYREVARRNADDPALSPSAVNGFWSDRARAFLVDHPAAAVDRLRTKLQYVFHGFRWHDLPAAWVYDRYLPVPGVPYALLAALALPGLLLELRRRADSLMLYAVLGSQIAVMLVFYVSPRQRLILIPLFLYFACVALDAVLRGRRWWAALLAVALFPAFALPDEAMRDEVYQRTHMERTRMELSRVAARLATGEPMAALEADFADALSHSPWWLEGLQPAFLPRDDLRLERRVAEAAEDRGLSFFDRGQIQLQAGNTGAARELLLESVAWDERFYRQGRFLASPRLLLARIDLRAGRREEALTRLEEALDEAPGHAYLLAELFAAGGDPAHLDALTRYYGRHDAGYLVGRAFLAQNRPREAIDPLRRTVQAFPRLRHARLALAAALARAGRMDEGLAQVQAADDLQPDPALFADDMAELYRFSARGSEDPETLLRAAQGLFHYGRPAEALALLDREWSGELGTRAEALDRRLRRVLAAADGTPGVR